MNLLNDERFKRLKDMADRTVSGYSSEWQDKHASFIDEAWPSSVKRKDPVYLKWKFRSSDQNKISGLLLATDQGKVVGQLGLIPVKISINNRVMDAQWGCNFKVLQHLEGTGYGSLLDIKSLALKPFTLGAAPSPQSEEIKIKLGFKKLEGPRIMAYPINFSFFVRLKLSSFPSVVKLGVSFLSKIAFHLLHLRNYVVRPDKQKVTEGSYEDVVRNIEILRKEIPVLHVVHDPEYLHWRCQAVGNYRKEAKSIRTTNGSFVLYYCTSSYCYLFEFFFINKKEKKILLRKLLAIASENKVAGLYTYANTGNEEKDLAQFGFFGFRRKIDIYVYSADKTIDLGERMHLNTYDSDGNI